MNAFQISACGTFVTIQLLHGYTATVDAADWPTVQQFRWGVRRKGRNIYAQANVRRGNKQTTLQMHRLLLQPPDHVFTDHIDGNGLNNRRGNLRLCDPAENARNRRAPQTTTAPYKGVSWCPRNRRWRAQICVAGKKRYLGLFDEPEDAATAYNFAAAAEFGAFARFNEPTGAT